MPIANDDALSFWPRAFSTIVSSAESSTYAADPHLEELWRTVVVRMILMARVLYPSQTTTQQDDVVKAVIEKLLTAEQLKQFLIASDPQAYISALLRRAGREMLNDKRSTEGIRPDWQDQNEIRKAEQDRHHELRKRADEGQPRAIRLLPVRVWTSENETAILDAVDRMLEETGFVARV